MNATPNHNLANVGAIPHTAKRPASSWRCFRRPRGAASALRAGARHVPPDAWDDIPIAALASRTWKRHRRTQYHCVEG